MCQGEAVWPVGRRGLRKGRLGTETVVNRRASPTTFQACPLSLTGLSKLKRLVFFWREVLKPLSILSSHIPLWLPTNPRNSDTFTNFRQPGVNFSFLKCSLPSWTYLIHLHLFSSSFLLSACETQEPENWFQAANPMPDIEFTGCNINRMCKDKMHYLYV